MITMFVKYLQTTEADVQTDICVGDGSDLSEWQVHTDHGWITSSLIKFLFISSEAKRQFHSLIPAMHT